LQNARFITIQSKILLFKQALREDWRVRGIFKRMVIAGMIEKGFIREVPAWT